MTSYTINAYDTDHNKLWIARSGVAEPCRRTNSIVDVIRTYRLKTGQVIDPRTSRPVTITDEPTKGRLRIAYFRTYTGDEIWEIYITKHGRSAGVRNYQARRPNDKPCTSVLGWPPIHTEPRIVSIDHGCQIHLGEGDPYDLCNGRKNIDRWSDPALCVATCHQVSSSDTEAGWWGYSCYNHWTSDYCALDYATEADAHQHLRKIACEMIGKYGADITQW